VGNGPQGGRAWIVRLHWPVPQPLLHSAFVPVRPLPFLLVLVTLWASGGARADDCDDVTPVDAARRFEPAMVAGEVVVPCAMVDSGAFGANCADAFYVLTPQGIALCRLDTLIASAVPDGPTLAPDDPETVANDRLVAVALPAAEAPIPRPPLAGRVARPHPVDDDGPVDDHRRRPRRPSWRAG